MNRWGRGVSLSLIFVVMFLSAARAQQPRREPLPISAAMTMQRFVFPAVFDSPIDLSPDGQFVAYTVEDQEQGDAPVRDVWVTDVRTGETRKLNSARGASWRPAWSPDSRRLAFFSDREGPAQVWVWDRATGESRASSRALVKPQAGNRYGGERLRWTPDGKKILTQLMPEQATASPSIAEAAARGSSPSGANADPGLKLEIYTSTGVKSPAAQSVRAVRSGPAVSAGDLALITVEDGHIERLAAGVNTLWYQVSPDGASIAYSQQKGMPQQGVWQLAYDLTVVSLTGKARRVVAADVYQHYGLSVTWSPDSRWLAYTTSGALAKGDCFVVAADGSSAPRLLTPQPHPYFGNHLSSPQWDADGQNFYVIGASDRASSALWRIPIGGAAPREITRIAQNRLLQIIRSGDKVRPWAPDQGRSVVLLTQNQQAQTCFYKVDLTTGQHALISAENKNLGGPYQEEEGFDLSADGRTMVCMSEDAQHPSDIWARGVQMRDARRVTRLSPEADNYLLGESRLVEWQAVEGQTMRGALLLPAGYEPGKRYPLIVSPYPGDQRSQFINSFSCAAQAFPLNNWQLLATRGYAVLMPDTVYRKGTIMRDIADSVMPGVDKVIEMGVADPERLGVIGHSAGGYAVMSLVVQTTRFKAAVVEAGFADLAGLFGYMGHPSGMSQHTPSIESWAGGMPWEKPLGLIENSPLFYLDRVKTPILLVHGSADESVGNYQADQIFVGLRRLEKEVTYLRYLGESHVPYTWSTAHQIDYLQRRIAWFDKWLKAERPANAAEPSR